MLVLSRKTEQTIQIGDEITITVLKVKGNQVRLGISAPNDVRVIRGELVLEMEDEEVVSESPLEIADNSVAVFKSRQGDKARFNIEPQQAALDENLKEASGSNASRGDRTSESGESTTNRIAKLFPEAAYQVHLLRSTSTENETDSNNS